MDECPRCKKLVPYFSDVQDLHNECKKLGNERKRMGRCVACGELYGQRPHGPDYCNACVKKPNWVGYENCFVP